MMVKDFSMLDVNFVIMYIVNMRRFKMQFKEDTVMR